MGVGMISSREGEAVMDFSRGSQGFLWEAKNG